MGSEMCIRDRKNTLAFISVCIIRKEVVSTFELHPKSFVSNFRGVFLKYSYEQRLIIVSRVKQGEAISHLSKEYHINGTQIFAWVRMCDKYGHSGLEQQPYCRPMVKLKK